MNPPEMPAAWLAMLRDLDEEQAALVRMAMEASRNADCRTSHISVGASASTVEGKRYAGANVDSGPHANSTCAERTAMGAARATEGDRLRLAQVTVFSDVASCPPCGSCRQAMHDHNPQLSVVFPKRGRLERMSASDLLPDAPDTAVDEHAPHASLGQYAPLVAAAREAEAQAYCRYTGIPSGAAVLCASGHSYRGTAVQSAAFGRNSTSAELNAIAAARLAEGEALRIIAVASASAMRCGAPDGTSRQSLVEFAAPRAVAIYPRYGRYRTVQLSSLLPIAFELTPATP